MPAVVFRTAGPGREGPTRYQDSTNYEKILLVYRLQKGRKLSARAQQHAVCKVQTLTLLPAPPPGPPAAPLTRARALCRLA